MSAIKNQKSRIKNVTWPRRFADAFRALFFAVRTENSFWVHLTLAAAVVALAAALRVTRIEWCLLVLCIAGVLAAEMFNTALEWLGQAVTQEHDPRIATVLEMGSAAVLVTALGAVAVGLMILGSRLLEWLA